MDEGREVSDSLIQLHLKRTPTTRPSPRYCQLSTVVKRKAAELPARFHEQLAESLGGEWRGIQDEVWKGREQGVKTYHACCYSIQGGLSYPCASRTSIEL